MLSADQLHVITVISNPARYRSRAHLHRLNQAHQAAAGVTRWVVEATFGERPPEATVHGDPHHIIVRCDHELWLKENLINLAIEHLPANWRYVMWMDGDIEFARPDWATETLEALQHWRVVQPFSHAIDLGPDYEVIQHHTGFAYNYNRGLVMGDPRYPFFHPGYCWAWRRDAWEAVGGMIERAICGAGDHHMAAGLIGKAELTFPGNIHPNYAKMVLDWQRLAQQRIERDVGHVPGAILHSFHGWKEDRNYQGRWEILHKAKYDPEAAVVKDARGVLNLAPGQTYLRDLLRGYFRSRNEDAGRRRWPA